MNISAAFSQKTARATGQYRGNFGHNRQRYFLGRFTAGVEPGWREQIVQGAIEIDDRIFAQLCQNLGMTFLWSE
jgi:hypothetical protein